MASLKDIFRRGVEDLIIEGSNRETARERFEGPAEMANPAVVPQPVRNSATATGQPLNFIDYVSKNQTTLLLGFGGLLLLGITILAFKAIKG